jgi:hypothetical protein
MSNLRLLAAAAIAFAAISAPATLASGRLAALLPEVQKHLDDARKCASDGSADVAVAHADLILLGDEIKYSVQFVDVPERLQSRSTKAMDAALAGWKDALEDTVGFRQVTDPNDAQVVIRFKKGVMMGKEPVAGFANWKRSLVCDGPRVQSSSFRATLQIRTLDLDGNPMPQECVRHEIQHEMGHVFGLEDSNSTGDLMGPLDMERPVARPRPYESDAVLQLRESARRIKAEASVRG